MIFGLALLVVFLAGGYFLFKYIASVFATLEPQVATLAAIASVVALLCAVIIAEGLKARGQKDYLSLATVEKMKTYEQLLSLWSEEFKRDVSGDAREAEVELVKLEQLLVLHGSAKVITAYDKLRRLVKQDGKPGDTALALLSKLLMEMRRDMGRTEFIRKENDLLELLLRRS